MTVPYGEPSPALTSTRNERVQAVRRLHRRSARLAERRFVVEGPQAVREALGSLVELFATDPGHPLAVEAARRGVLVTQVADAVLLALGETVNPQGLVGVAPLVDVDLGTALAGRPRLVAVLHGVTDPGNAGTVIRTADAAGADAVVLTGETVDPHNGKCVRASAGSLWHLPVVTGAMWDEAFAQLSAAGLQVLATSGTGEDDLDDLQDAGLLAAPTAWVLGSEAHGLPPDVLERADRRVRVPLHGRAESLNVASAAAVCLYACAREHRSLPEGT